MISATGEVYRTYNRCYLAHDTQVSGLSKLGLNIKKEKLIIFLSRKSKLFLVSVFNHMQILQNLKKIQIS